MQAIQNYINKLNQRYQTGISGEHAYRGELQHLQGHENLGLIVTRQLSTFNFQHIFVTEQMFDGNMISLQTKEYGYTFPLYLYPESTNQQSTKISSHRVPNLAPDIVNQIADQLDLKFTDEKQDTENTFAPIDLLDYIYAILHSPCYRDTYQEFLKIDFPRVPYPDKDTFWQLVRLGAELRQIHLLESLVLDHPISRYPQDGDNIIHRKINKTDFELDAADNTRGRIWINDQQYFADIPLIAWEFFIGGYQPAQKWLKDRRERTLDFEGILHYQKIIVALSETHRVMLEIDQVFIL